MSPLWWMLLGIGGTAVFGGLLIGDLRTGRTSVRGGTFKRRTEPYDYWSAIATLVVATLIFAVIALVNLHQVTAGGL